MKVLHSSALTPTIQAGSWRNRHHPPLRRERHQALAALGLIPPR